jgi:hypothetical protein
MFKKWMKKSRTDIGQNMKYRHLAGSNITDDWSTGPMHNPINKFWFQANGGLK